MRVTEKRIINAMRHMHACKLSVRDTVRVDTVDGRKIAVYTLWSTDMVSLADGSTVFVKLISERNSWYGSRTTQSRLRAFGFYRQ